mmetsp:Transcript_24589/g.76101  ORF Transcript_24589/g.76101 Transcript_24589/m.76101 type:complete len:230 (+) Transcript_24589:258-947(+)
MASALVVAATAELVVSIACTASGARTGLTSGTSGTVRDSVGGSDRDAVGGKEGLGVARLSVGVRRVAERLTTVALGVAADSVGDRVARDGDGVNGADSVGGAVIDLVKERVRTIGHRSSSTNTSRLTTRNEGSISASCCVGFTRPSVETHANVAFIAGGFHAAEATSALFTVTPPSVLPPMASLPSMRVVPVVSFTTAMFDTETLEAWRTSAPSACTPSIACTMLTFAR